MTMKDTKKDIFTRFLYEAEEDEGAPDEFESPDFGDDGGGQEETGGGDMPEYDPAGDEDNGSPPDMPDFGGDDDGDDYGDYDDQESGEGEDDSKKVPENLNDKVSALMNANLYQSYLSLLQKFTAQQQAIKNNRDVLYTISPESLDTLDSLKKLDENMRLYMKNSFVNENYSKNLLFFNKCLTLYRLIVDQFAEVMKKGTKDLKN